MHFLLPGSMYNSVFVIADTHGESYPGCVLSQVTSFVLYAVWVLYALQEFHLLDYVLPFL